MAHLESLVVLDSSARTRSALTFGFERAGYKVYATGESSDALAMAQTRVPQLVVASMQGGEDSDESHEALSLVGRLREESATRELPIVVLGERGAREPALRAGADEFVARPAFIRDVLTLARLAVALRQDGDESGVAGLLEDYGLYFLTRALAVAGRTGVIELERARRAGEIRIVQGDVVAARVGRMSGVAAFHHLLLWGEASMQLRFETPAGERKINVGVDELLSTGAAFAREFEALSARIGGVQAVYRQVPRRAAEARAQIPAEVMGLVKHYDGQRPFIDVVEDSGFKPLDTIKITYRLQQLGVIERVEVEGAGEPLSAQLAVRDWLLGAQAAEGERSTVTEAGRRAAEAIAEAHALKAAPPPAAPEEEILDDTQKVRTAAAGPQAAAAPRAAVEDGPTAPREGERGPQARNKKKRKRDTAPTPNAEEPHDTAPTPKAEPAAPAPVDDSATIPFTKLPFDVIESLPPIAAAAPKPAPAPAPVAAKPAPAPAPAAAKPAPAPVAAKPAPAPAAKKTVPAKPAAATPVAHLHKSTSTGATPKLAEPKHASKPPHTSKPAAAPHDPKDPAFSDFEEEFFASASELAKIHPVETFDDLEPKRAPPKRGWFGFGAKLDNKSKSPKKR